MKYKNKLFLGCVLITLFATASGVSIAVLQLHPTTALLLGIIAAAICVAALLLILSRLLRPLNYLDKAGRRFLNGDRTLRLENPPVNSRDELSVAVQAFNTAVREARHSRVESEQMEQIFGTISTMLDDILFVYDLQSDIITFSNDWNLKNPATELFGIMCKDHSVHPDDESAFFRFFDQLKKGATGLTKEVRMILDGHDDYVWSRLWGTTLLSDDGVPRKIIGRRVNIDREKKERQALVENAQRDAMTHLYNSATFAARAASSMEVGGGAMFVIDVDDFKALNDGLGHLFGNAVLTQIAARLQEQFPPQVVIGRVGGDEFALYSPLADTEEQVAKTAEMILRLFQRGVVNMSGQWKISCSVGAARCTPALSGSYDELFQMADDAMYHAKSAGKNCWELYHDELKGYHTCYAKRKDTAERDENVLVSLTDNLTEYIFNILYETPEINAAVQLILEIVGRYYSVSRAYIFENSQDNEICKNTFEWCAAGIEPMIDDLDDIRYDLFEGSYQNNFDESGIFYCVDINSLPEYTKKFLGNQVICSTLQAAILSEGKFCGFDECTGNRVWTANEVATLSFIAKVLSLFLLRRTAEKRERDLARSMETILDNQKMLSYVVDKNTYKLQFFNRNTRELVPDIKPNDICYRVFMGREQPCDFCLLPFLSAETPNQQKEIYNPYLNIWVDTNAALIPWMDGSERCLLCCYDITRYKEQKSANSTAPVI